jgi:hypothetical protein
VSTPAVEIRSFAVTIPHGTTLPATFTQDIFFPARIVTGIHWKVPPGPSGLMGWRLTMSNGNPVIPTGGGWIIADDQDATWPLADQPDSGAWEITGYNTDIYDHTVYVDFFCDLVGQEVSSPQLISIPSSAGGAPVSTPAAVSVPVSIPAASTPAGVSVPPFSVPPPATVPVFSVPPPVQPPPPVSVPVISVPVFSVPPPVVVPPISVPPVVAPPPVSIPPVTVVQPVFTTSPPPRLVTIPITFGKSANEALSMIRAAGFTATTSPLRNEAFTYVSHGSSPEGGHLAPAGSHVTVNVVQT